MSAKTRQQLYSDFSNNQRATGEKFADLIDSFKPVQTAVSDPASAGSATEFISNISQDVEGKITVQKKSVNFGNSPYKPKQSPYINPEPDGEGLEFLDTLEQNENGVVKVTKKKVKLSGVKPKQSPVSSPSASGNSTAFIDSIVQNEDGVISVTKKNVDFSGYKTRQAPVDDSSVTSGEAIIFVDKITQNENGEITVSKKKVDSGQFLSVQTARATYQPISSMSVYLTDQNARATYLTIQNAQTTYLTIRNAQSVYLSKTEAQNTYQSISGMSDYQNKDKQVVDGITVGPNNAQTIRHNKGHYPTVRLINANNGDEASDFKVQHVDENNLKIILGSTMTGGYKYILD